MSMTPAAQEPTVSDGGSYTFSNYIVFLTMIVATSRPGSEIRRRCLRLPVRRFPSFCQEWLKRFLEYMGVPQTFLDGHDCNMLPNLSIMLCDSVLQRDSELERRGNVDPDFSCVFVMVFKTHCSYNVVNTPGFFQAELVPSRELVQRMACEGGEHSLPTGATTLGRFKVKDEKDKCFICFEEYNSGDDAARLPCSHVCHYDCILEWFVQRSTCPVCRFACSHASCYRYN